MPPGTLEGHDRPFRGLRTQSPPRSAARASRDLCPRLRLDLLTEGRTFQRGARPLAPSPSSGQPFYSLNEPRNLTNRPGSCVTNAFSASLGVRTRASGSTSER